MTLEQLDAVTDELNAAISVMDAIHELLFADDSNAGTALTLAEITKQLLEKARDAVEAAQLAETA